MNADLWPSEAIVYGLMIANGVVAALALFWALRRGQLTDLDETMHRSLELGLESPNRQEDDHDRTTQS